MSELFPKPYSEQHLLLKKAGARKCSGAGNTDPSKDEDKGGELVREKYLAPGGVIIEACKYACVYSNNLERVVCSHPNRYLGESRIPFIRKLRRMVWGEGLCNRHNVVPPEAIVIFSKKGVRT